MNYLAADGAADYRRGRRQYVNYWIGSAIGQKVFTHDYRWLDKDALHKTHAFYENHGGKTIILARFVPIVRTFAPFVAGVSDMTFAKFQFFNITGAALWVVGLVSAGYFFGNIPIIRDHLNTIVLIGVGAAVIPLAMGGVWKFYEKVRPRLKRAATSLGPALIY